MCAYGLELEYSTSNSMVKIQSSLFRHMEVALLPLILPFHYPKVPRVLSMKTLTIKWIYLYYCLPSSTDIEH